MSDGLISLLLAVAALVGVALIVALPDNWLQRLARRGQAPGRSGTSALTPQTAQEHRLLCAECGETSSPGAAAWKAYLTLDGEALFLCPACAERELGRRNLRGRRPAD